MNYFTNKNENAMVAYCVLVSLVALSLAVTAVMWLEQTIAKRNKGLSSPKTTDPEERSTRHTQLYPFALRRPPRSR